MRCMELGAGIGLVGIFAAKLGCKHACVTDLPEVLPILERNVAANPEVEAVSAAPLAWGTEDWRSVMNT